MGRYYAPVLFDPARTSRRLPSLDVLD